MHQTGRASNGFSLIELVTVLVIIGALTAIGLPRYADAQQRYRAATTARQIAADLNRVRTSARAVSVEQRVNFAVSSQQYTRPELPEPYDADAVTQSTVNLGPAHDHARLLEVDFNDQPTLTYNAYGRPVDGGYLLVGNANLAKRLTVNPETGRAAVTQGFEPSP